MFRAIASENFPPFGDLRLMFPPVEGKPEDLAEVHLFTGVNGTGKTRLLTVLAAMLGNAEPLVRRLKGVEHAFPIHGTSKLLPNPHFEFQDSTLQVSSGGAVWSYLGKMASWAQRVPAFAYSGTAYVTDVKIALLGDIPRPERNLCLSFVRPESHSQSLLQAITNLKVQTAMDAMDKSPEAASQTRSTRIVRALESTLGEITGRPFLFQVTSYPALNLGVAWGGIKLSFDAMPDGLRSIIGWLAHAVVTMDAWLQGNGDPMQTEAVFLLDEIESNLHPAWQRRILPAFQRLFPKAQIFIATHSPFLIASLNHGWIHPLTIGPDGIVNAEEPVPASEGDSYITVLEEIMGLNEWYDPETEALLARFREARDAAFHGVTDARLRARDLAGQIGKRSMELDYMMGKELSQMDRQLAKAASVK